MIDRHAGNIGRIPKIGVPENGDGAAVPFDPDHCNPGLHHIVMFKLKSPQWSSMSGHKFSDLAHIVGGQSVADDTPVSPKASAASRARGIGKISNRS